MNDITFSSACAQMLLDFEGFRSHAYVDPGTGGEPITIGIGSTHYCDGTKVTMQDTPISKQQAMDTCLCHLNNIILPDLQKHVTVDLTQNQIDALGSLIYNIGTHGFDTSHVLSDINAGIVEGDLYNRWIAWSKSGGKTMNGLLIRRQKEYNYFTTGAIT